jgi:hypothetical protein
MDASEVRNCDHLRIIGVSEVPHFNRCFRWRFGDVPKSYRPTPDPAQAAALEAWGYSPGFYLFATSLASKHAFVHGSAKY